MGTASPVKQVNSNVAGFIGFLCFSGDERLICPVTGPRRFPPPNHATGFEIFLGEGAGTLKTPVGGKGGSRRRAEAALPPTLLYGAINWRAAKA
jgi:hypothetical protein